MEQREITTLEGQANFPQNDNDVLELIEKIGLQENKSLKSANQFRDGLRQIKVENGKVLEQSVIKMAESRIFDKDATSREPLDPTLAVTYHNNFDKRQYQTTIRKSDIRAVIANKGLGVDEMTTNILATLSEGSDAEEYEKSIDLIYNADIVDFATITGKKPKNMRGVLYMIRKAYNALKHNNDNLCTAHNFKCATPESDIHIAFSTDLSNLIDVGELADMLHLEKASLLGKINLFDTSYDAKKNRFMVFVYDINAFGRAERDNNFETEHVARGEFDNAYKSVDDAFYHCGLFKAVKFDVTDAGESEEAQILDDVEVVEYSVALKLDGATADTPIAEKVKEGQPIKTLFTASEGRVLDPNSKVSGTMGRVDLIEGKQLSWNETNAKWELNIPNVKGDVSVDIVAD